MEAENQSTDPVSQPMTNHPNLITSDSQSQPGSTFVPAPKTPKTNATKNKKKMMFLLASIGAILIIAFLLILNITRDDKINKNEAIAEPYVLNSRQISICEDLGLPTVYEELTYNQRIGIVRIEELLSYLDNKYNDVFYYVGYYKKSLFEKERIKAYTNKFSEYEYATLTVQDDGSYKDDYPLQFVKKISREDLIEYLPKETGFVYKVYVISSDTELTDVLNINLSSISGTSRVSFDVIVSGEKTIQETQMIGYKITEWYKKTGIYGRARVIAVDGDAFDSINYENYSGVRRDPSARVLAICDVTSTGDVEVKIEE